MSEVLAPTVHSRPAGSTAAFDQHYWLEHCEGFRVDCDGGRLGFVEEVRTPATLFDHGVLGVRAGILGRRLLLVPAEEVRLRRPARETDLAEVLASDRGKRTLRRMTGLAAAARPGATREHAARPACGSTDRREFRCAACGYGAVARVNPSCPMCGRSDWIPGRFSGLGVAHAVERRTR